MNCARGGGGDGCYFVKISAKFLLSEGRGVGGAGGSGGMRGNEVPGKRKNCTFYTYQLSKGGRKGGFWSLFTTHLLYYLYKKILTPLRPPPLGTRLNMSMNYIKKSLQQSVCFRPGYIGNHRAYFEQQSILLVKKNRLYVLQLCTTYASC